jgi:hypothetical protein
MISLFLTAMIVWKSNTVPICGTGEPGCYIQSTNTIYVSTKPYDGVGADFILYHEIGHSFYKKAFPISIFPDGSMGDPSYEMIANDFAWWMYGQKYPKQYGAFAKDLLNKNQLAYFQGTCNSKCVTQILKVKIK